MPKIVAKRIRIAVKGKEIVPADEYSKGELRRGLYGTIDGEKLLLHPEEAFYLVNMRRSQLLEDGKEIGLKEFLRKFYFPRFFVRYNTFRDWRDRGLFLEFDVKGGPYGKSPVKDYPSQKFSLPLKPFQVHFLPEEMCSIIFEKEAKILFEKYWIGQWGVYKDMKRGNLLKLDPLETLYLCKNGYEVVNVENGEQMNFDSLLQHMKKSVKIVEALYSVYEDWRNRGYILKTGFKFGTHFRIYFPGASPVRKDKWIHSKHVIHVFPKDVSMIMSEWGRAVRVAHSVRKTFIMAIPGMSKEDYLKEKTPIDFVAYHRKKNGVERPGEDDPSFLIIALDEDEELSGKMLASALDRADELGLRLLIAITDRETSVTYYVANRIRLPGSQNRYYEIEWFTP